MLHSHFARNINSLFQCHFYPSHHYSKFSSDISCTVSHSLLNLYPNFSSTHWHPLSSQCMHLSFILQTACSTSPTTSLWHCAVFVGNLPCPVTTFARSVFSFNICHIVTWLSFLSICDICSDMTFKCHLSPLNGCPYPNLYFSCHSTFHDELDSALQMLCVTILPHHVFFCNTLHLVQPSLTHLFHHTSSLLVPL